MGRYCTLYDIGQRARRIIRSSEIVQQTITLGSVSTYQSTHQPQTGSQSHTLPEGRQETCKLLTEV